MDTVNFTRTLFFTSRSPCKSVSLRPSFHLAVNCSRYQPQPSSQLDKMINSCRNRLKSTVDRNLNRKIYLLARKCSSAPVTAPMSMMNMAGVAVFSSICFGAIGLGIWQTKRYAWKIGVIEQSKTKLNDAADIIPDLKQADLVAYVSQMRGRRVSVTGTFDHSNEILLGPRSAPAGLMGAVAQGLAINPQGYFIITPLIRNDGTTVFINRGWVAMKETTWVRPTGVVTLNTVVSEVEKKNTFSPKNDPKSKRLLWIEPEALRLCLKEDTLALDEIVVLEEFEKDDTPVTSYPAVRRQSQLNEEHVSPVTHMVYAITWFSLAAAGFVMTYYKFRGPVVRKLRSRIPPLPK